MTSQVHSTDRIIRMFPPAPLLNRETIEEIELGGYKVPQGVRQIIPLTSQPNYNVDTNYH